MLLRSPSHWRPFALPGARPIAGAGDPEVPGRAWIPENGRPRRGLRRMDGHEVIGWLHGAGRVVLRQCGVRRRRQGYSLEIPYPARLEPQSGGGFCVRFAGFDEAFTGGETVGDAPCDAIEALLR